MISHSDPPQTSTQHKVKRNSSSFSEAQCAVQRLQVLKESLRARDGHSAIVEGSLPNSLSSTARWLCEDAAYFGRVGNLDALRALLQESSASERSVTLEYGMCGVLVGHHKGPLLKLCSNLQEDFDPRPLIWYFVTLMSEQSNQISPKYSTMLHALLKLPTSGPSHRSARRISHVEFALHASVEQGALFLVQHLIPECPEFQGRVDALMLAVKHDQPVILEFILPIVYPLSQGVSSPFITNQPTVIETLLEAHRDAVRYGREQCAKLLLRGGLLQWIKQNRAWSLLEDSLLVGCYHDRVNMVESQLRQVWTSLKTRWIHFIKYVPIFSEETLESLIRLSARHSNMVLFELVVSVFLPLVYPASLSSAASPPSKPPSHDLCVIHEGSYSATITANTQPDTAAHYPAQPLGKTELSASGETSSSFSSESPIWATASVSESPGGDPSDTSDSSSPGRITESTCNISLSDLSVDPKWSSLSSSSPGSGKSDQKHTPLLVHSDASAMYVPVISLKGSSEASPKDFSGEPPKDACAETRERTYQESIENCGGDRHSAKDHSLSMVNSLLWLERATHWIDIACEENHTDFTETLSNTTVHIEFFCRTASG